MSEKLLPLAAMEKIMKNMGSSRVSQGSKEALKEALEKYGEKIAQDSVRFAKHAGRKTVKKEDIILASKSN